MTTTSWFNILRYLTYAILLASPAILPGASRGAIDGAKDDLIEWKTRLNRFRDDPTAVTYAIYDELKTQFSDLTGRRHYLEDFDGSEDVRLPVAPEIDEALPEPYTALEQQEMAQENEPTISGLAPQFQALIQKISGALVEAQSKGDALDKVNGLGHDGEETQSPLMSERNSGTLTEFGVAAVNNLSKTKTEVELEEVAVTTSTAGEHKTGEPANDLMNTLTGFASFINKVSEVAGRRDGPDGDSEASEAGKKIGAKILSVAKAKSDARIFKQKDAPGDLGSNMARLLGKLSAQQGNEAPGNARSGIEKSLGLLKIINTLQGISKVATDQDQNSKGHSLLGLLSGSKNKVGKSKSPNTGGISDTINVIQKVIGSSGQQSATNIKGLLDTVANDDFRAGVNSFREYLMSQSRHSDVDDDMS
ncbi:hypothetical protein BX600DRAFT_459602 [Xylariales sp. PMI_506]|nr:hypothetical protein BX600DRAFT_459602 [Xylariales sp. PMI_506]